MVGNPKSNLTLVQRLGFFWEYPYSVKLQEVLKSQDPAKLKKAAYQQVMVLTSLLDGNYSAYGMRMINALGLNSLEKIWKYRLHLIRTFEIKLPQDRPQPVWLQSETAEGYRLAKLVKEFAKALPRKEYRVRGVVIGEFKPDF